MTAKQFIHEWIDEMSDDSPLLRDLHEQARIDRALDEAEQSIREGRVSTFEEIEQRMRHKWAQHNSK